MIKQQYLKCFFYSVTLHIVAPWTEWRSIIFHEKDIYSMFVFCVLFCRLDGCFGIVVPIPIAPTSYVNWCVNKMVWFIIIRVVLSTPIQIKFYILFLVLSHTFCNRKDSRHTQHRLSRTCGKHSWNSRLMVFVCVWRWREIICIE